MSMLTQAPRAGEQPAFEPTGSTTLDAIVLDVYAYQLFEVYSEGDPALSWEDLNERMRTKWRAVAAQAIRIAEENAP